ncbi:MAG: hypothetical protein LW817_00195 [Candidatus Caenarcaniphilales bacterium]|jgi:hypothetical protein|nr:hypothetical protein [Candidatus Caenarcaniphilales bacterium]
MMNKFSRLLVLFFCFCLISINAPAKAFIFEGHKFFFNGDEDGDAGEVEPEAKLIEDIEIIDIDIPEPPAIVIDPIPVVIVIGDFDCTILAGDIADLLAAANALKASLAAMKADLNTKLADMRTRKAKANALNQKMQDCFGIMKTTNACVAPGYFPADWDNHNPAVEIGDLSNYFDDAHDQIANINNLNSQIDSLINSLNDLNSQLAACKTEAEAQAIANQLAALSAQLDALHASAATIQNNINTAIDNFNNTLNAIMNKIAAFIRATKAILAAHHPSNVRNIMRDCGFNAPRARVEAAQRGKVKRCINALDAAYDRAIKTMN